MTRKTNIVRRPKSEAKVAEPVATPPTPNPETRPERPVATSTKKSAGTKLNLDGLHELADMDMDELNAALSSTQGPPGALEQGDKVVGIVTAIENDYAMLDIEAKGDGVLTISPGLEISVGDTITAYVVHSSEFEVRLTTQLEGEAAAQLLDSALVSGTPIQGRVVGVNSGGFDIMIGNKRGFCPISQMTMEHLQEPEIYLQTEQLFKVVETGKNIVLSRRALLEQEAMEQASQTWSKLFVGRELTGTVKSAHPFGVFVTTGGVTGLIPRRFLGEGEEDPVVSTEISVTVHAMDAANDKLTFTLHNVAAPQSEAPKQYGDDTGFGTLAALLGKAKGDM